MQNFSQGRSWNFFRLWRPPRALLESSWRGSRAQEAAKALPEASGVDFWRPFGSQNGALGAFFFELPWNGVLGLSPALFWFLALNRMKILALHHYSRLLHSNARNFTIGFPVIRHDCSGSRVIHQHRRCRYGGSLFARTLPHTAESRKGLEGRDARHTQGSWKP